MAKAPKYDLAAVFREKVAEITKRNMRIVEDLTHTFEEEPPEGWDHHRRTIVAAGKSHLTPTAIKSAIEWTSTFMRAAAAHQERPQLGIVKGVVLTPGQWRRLAETVDEDTAAARKQIEAVAVENEKEEEKK